ncbi:spore germination protein, amino acid permease [Halobacteroides halobius DSM 5150]|uniref:Spore germination protein, amino acid permease n=1 Tax=Halobacteroides halobius (strain ATCC 35273 / DSM 5150 / MD-1) TaxID=748449 RepID=L0K6V0_HALHC|nr:GerAB/ArcD/ProY family transporter [Halobacteroides halobius]AGB40997.1 spore germination protein, amino acid permease [Halobacteroides halobius DSM 5150]
MQVIGGQALFFLVLIFVIGNTGLYALGVQLAKQDAWIALLLAMFSSYILLWIYVKLQNYYPEDNLAQIIIKITGKWLGYSLILLYSAYFFYISLLNLSMYTEFIQVYLIQGVAKSVISFLLIFNFTYLIFSGVEVIARVSELITPFIIFAIVIVYILVFSSGAVDFKRLQPVLSNGIQPIIEVTIPELIIFPFGDLVLFLMFWKYVNDKKSIFKISFWGMTIAGLIITFAVIIILAVLGVNLAIRAYVPNMLVSQMIQIKWLANIDVIIVLIILLLGFYKMVPFFYGSVAIVATGFKFDNKVFISILYGLLLLIFSYAPFTGFPFHRWINSFGPRIERFMEYMHVLFQMIIPTILLVVTWLKKSELFKK